MTGRELIVYILENNLQDEEIFKDGKFVGFITADEAAAKLNVGVATIYAYIKMGKIHAIATDKVLIPANFKVKLGE